ncbi:hypothetical protein NP590_10430 [Methylomonas sp. SURF-2]|uniref:Uncharacterized protein n=1 Tax=Methylomonas subterranea TaxID=2952225 RepID=A0ABT1TGG0_9GAMM|nr:hypothetical protein [Methylomonas sp. SURF-2]MCQ8104520.1 hypothetical protein [Methylomonas sp. SURF-2]
MTTLSASASPILASIAAKVKDEVARAWADAQDYWRIFQRKLDTLKTDSPATTQTRNNRILCCNSFRLCQNDPNGFERHEQCHRLKWRMNKATR